MPKAKTESAQPKWDWDAARREQLRAALRMTPAERLEWLENTTLEMRELLGLARRR